MRRTTANIIMMILAFILEHSIFAFLRFLPAAPNLMLILVFTISFVYGEREGIFYGVIAGVLTDLFYSGPLGLYTVVFVWIGFVNGLFSKYYYEDYILLPISICILNELFMNITLFVFLYFTNGIGNFFFYLRTLILPEMTITVIFTLILYRPVLSINRKLKKMDEAKKGLDKFVK